jgi:hypothetical protein
MCGLQNLARTQSAAQAQGLRRWSEMRFMMLMPVEPAALLLINAPKLAQGHY